MTVYLIAHQGDWR